MDGRGGLAVDEAGRAALERLSRSAARRAADRARAVLWSLGDETSTVIATRLGVRAEQVRRWRSAFRRGGAEALRSRPRPGRAPRQREAAPALARGGLPAPPPPPPAPAPAPLAAPGPARTRGAARRPAGLDPGPARGGGRGAHRRDDLRRSPERGAAKGGYRWRRPRHTLKGRQDARAVDYAGLRLRLLRQQARAGDIHLLFGDESEALTHPYLSHCWARRGADLRVEAPGQAKKRALLGVLDPAGGELMARTSAPKRPAGFVARLARLDRDYGPAAGRENRPVSLVLDSRPIHTSKASRKALAARPWLTVEWLPKYAPELNDIERSWRDLKRHYLAHRTFRDAVQLDLAIHGAVHALNRERHAGPCASISRAA